MTDRRNYHATMLQIPPRLNRKMLAGAPTGPNRPASAGPTTRQLVLVTMWFWVTELAVAELRSLVDHSVKFEVYTLLRTLSAIFGCMEFYLIHVVARLTEGRAFKLRALLIILLAAIAGVLNLKTFDLLQNLTSYPVRDYGAGWRIYNATYWALMFMAWASIYLALDYNSLAIEQERRTRTLERLAHDAQLRALRLQIDPHFLFNTLNSVSALVLEGRTAEAEAMIEKLSEFFRITLVTNPREDVTLGEELALQQLYLEIERVRFPDLSVEISLHPDAKGALVPPLLLQPLVENAVKFAVAGYGEATCMGISVGPPAGGLVSIEVWDEGRGANARAAKGTGTGLSNVRERLMMRFGAVAYLEFRATAPRGASARVVIPLQLNASRPS